jgi:hypothetical protein
VFSYQDSFALSHALESYERLILLAVIGDQSLFTSSGGIERLWEISEPLVQNPPPVEPYEPGSWGPLSVDKPIAPYHWHLPSVTPRRLGPALWVGVLGPAPVWPTRSRRLRGATNNGPRRHRYSVRFAERGWQDGRVTISERVEAGRREHHRPSVGVLRHCATRRGIASRARPDHYYSRARYLCGVTLGSVPQPTALPK